MSIRKEVRSHPNICTCFLHMLFCLYVVVRSGSTWKLFTLLFFFFANQWLTDRVLRCRALCVRHLFAESWFVKLLICKTMIRKNLVCKTMIRKTRICRSLICEALICITWICKTWFAELCLWRHPAWAIPWEVIWAADGKAIHWWVDCAAKIADYKTTLGLEEVGTPDTGTRP